MTRFRRLLPALLLAAYAAQCFWFMGTQSLTFDEPHHIKAGMEMWRLGRFEFMDGHPSLPRLWQSLPLLDARFQVEQVDETVATGFRPSPEAIARRARLMQVLLGVLLGWLVWSAARRFHSEGAANFALALFTFSPALIAHFSVATTDAAGVLMTFAAPLALLHWLQRSAAMPDGRLPRGATALLGTVLGVLLAAKYYTPPLFLLALLWVLASRGEGSGWRPRNWNWKAAAVVFGASFMVVWASYGFHVTRVTLTQTGEAELAIPGYQQPVVASVPLAMRATLYLPGVEYLPGFGSALDHNRRGHRSYFLGEVSPTGGWRLYFPTVILLKWPTAVLVLLLAGAVLAALRRYPWPRDALVFYSFPVLFFIPAITSKINIGDRHILPVYPFVLVFVAGLWELASRSARRKLWISVLLLAVAFLAADTWRYAPDYLSWFNILVAPEESWRLLADSSNDWGAGLLALRQYQLAHPEETIHLAYYGNLAPEVYGIRYVPLREGQRVTGTVVVSTVHLSGRLQRDAAAYRWLLQHRRAALLNHSLHVFTVE